MKTIFHRSLPVLIAAVVVIGILIAVVAFRIPRYVASSAIDLSSSSVEAMITSSDTQAFSGDGYTFTVPSSWQIEQIASSSIAAHDDDGCTFDLFQFPFSSETDTGTWIAEHITADPSLTVTEHSAEDVSVTGGTGIRWTGTIDGASTTLVYAFGGDHAYEIAPASNTDPACEDSLETFIGHLTLQ